MLGWRPPTDTIAFPAPVVKSGCYLVNLSLQGGFRSVTLPAGKSVHRRLDLGAPYAQLVARRENRWYR